MNLYLRAAGIGLVAGMRSMSAPALTSHYLSKEPSLFLSSSPLKGIASPTTANVLKFMALGEMIVDKLPGVPSRTDLGPLAARAVSGGVCAAAICAAEGEPPGVGAAIGAASAVASAFFFYTLRRNFGRATGIPDAVSALAEDTLALGIGVRVFAG